MPTPLLARPCRPPAVQQQSVDWPPHAPFSGLPEMHPTAPAQPATRLGIQPGSGSGHYPTRYRPPHSWNRAQRPIPASEYARHPPCGLAGARGPGRSSVRLCKRLIRCGRAVQQCGGCSAHHCCTVSEPLQPNPVLPARPPVLCRPAGLPATNTPATIRLAAIPSNPSRRPRLWPRSRVGPVERYDENGSRFKLLKFFSSQQITTRIIFETSCNPLNREQRLTHGLQSRSKVIQATHSRCHCPFILSDDT